MTKTDEPILGTSTRRRDRITKTDQATPGWQEGLTMFWKKRKSGSSPIKSRHRIKRIKARGDFEWFEVEGVSLTDAEIKENQAQMERWGVKPMRKGERLDAKITMSKSTLFSTLKRK